MSEVDDALEDAQDQRVYVYQCQLSYTDNEIILVKAYNQDHASQIIIDSYKDKTNLRITSLQPTSHDTTNSILNKTIN